jgi:hypothetical protein
LAQTYLSILGPVYDERDRFIGKASRWDTNTTADDIAKDAAPMIAAMRKADDKLLGVHWPPDTAADVKELVQAEEAAGRDLGAVADVTDEQSTADWFQHYQEDGAKVSAATDVVRADLGLPPLTH